MTSPQDSGLDMLIWQEAGKKSSQWMAGIRTGAGTGVELDKRNEADRAAEGKILAGGAAAEQANCIRLISGETMTLHFLKKSMPRMGPATVACRKVYVKSLP
jgi:hypothetical protein